MPFISLYYTFIRIFFIFPIKDTKKYKNCFKNDLNAKYR